MHKESYFSPVNLTDTVKRLADDLCPYLPKTPGLGQQGLSALLVIDMQHYFLDPASHAFVPSASAIVAHVVNLIKFFRATSRPVLFTRHGNTAADAGGMGRWWSALLETGSAAWPLTPEIATLAQKNEIIDKTQYDAFFGTDLQDQLLAAGVTELVICGVMTHLCCETTARAAFVRGFDVAMVGDACATYNYDLHLGSLRSLGHGFARIVWTQGFCL